VTRGQIVREGKDSKKKEAGLSSKKYSTKIRRDQLEGKRENGKASWNFTR